MNQLYIVGAGGLGREVLAYARDSGKDAADGAAFEIAGFLDDRRDALQGFDVGTAVVGSTSDVRIEPHHRYVIAVGDPAVRWRLAGALARRGARFASIVHPSAYVARGARIGSGCILAPFSFVGPSAHLHSHVVLNTYASIGHDGVVEPCAVLSPYAVANGGTVIGAGAFFGTHATLIVGKKVGAWAKLGAGATAYADIEPGALALGTPARGRVMFQAPAEPGPPEV